MVMQQVVALVELAVEGEAPHLVTPAEAEAARADMLVQEVEAVVTPPLPLRVLAALVAAEHLLRVATLGYVVAVVAESVCLDKVVTVLLEL